MKKIYNMKFRYYDYPFVLIVAFAYIILVIVSLGDVVVAELRRGDDLFLLFLILSLLSSFPIIMVWGYWWWFQREFFYSIIDENGYQSVRYGRKYCYVDKDKVIYYSVFYQPAYRKKYIVFSNEPFEFFERSCKGFIRYAIPFDYVYDYNKMIMLPYNEKTMLEFDIKKWIPAKVVEYGKYDRKTKCIVDAGYPKSEQRAAEFDQKLESIFNRKKDK